MNQFVIGGAITMYISIKLIDLYGMVTLWESNAAGKSSFPFPRFDYPSVHTLNDAECHCKMCLYIYICIYIYISTSYALKQIYTQHYRFH